MLYTRLAMCLEKSKVVVTWLAVHAMLSHMSMYDLQHNVALMFFWISENVAKWNTNLITKYKKNLKTKKIHPPGFDPIKCSNAIQRAPSWATTPLGQLAANSRNESTCDIYTYMYISIFSTPASRVYRHLVNHHCLCLYAIRQTDLFQIPYFLFAPQMSSLAQCRPKRMLPLCPPSAATADFTPDQNCPVGRNTLTATALGELDLALTQNNNKSIVHINLSPISLHILCLFVKKTSEFWRILYINKTQKVRCMKIQSKIEMLILPATSNLRLALIRVGSIQTALKSTDLNAVLQKFSGAKFIDVKSGKDRTS